MLLFKLFCFTKNGNCWCFFLGGGKLSSQPGLRWGTSQNAEELGWIQVQTQPFYSLHKSSLLQVNQWVVFWGEKNPQFGGWKLNQPIFWKICGSQIGSCNPKFRGGFFFNRSNHHLAIHRIGSEASKMEEIFFLHGIISEQICHIPYAELFHHLSCQGRDIWGLHTVLTGTYKPGIPFYDASL